MGRAYPDWAMTFATLERLVGQAEVLEPNVDNYRCREEAIDKAL